MAEEKRMNDNCDGCGEYLQIFNIHYRFIEEPRSWYEVRLCLHCESPTFTKIKELDKKINPLIPLTYR